MTTATKLDPVYDPTVAAAWLLARHPDAAHFVSRLGVWFEPEDGDTTRYPDLESLAHGINAADELGVEWKAYEYSHPAPRAHGFLDDDARDELYERAYDEWERKGPQTDNPVALAYGPMSSGEKRVLRMLAVLTPSGRVRFALGDLDGISLSCCYWHGQLVHRSFVDDWCDLISGRVMRP